MRGETLIFFDGQFWVALFSEQRAGEVVRIGRYVFGAEPSSAFFDQWLADGCPGLLMRDVQRIKSAKETKDTRKKKNPKRAIREVMKAMKGSNANRKESKAQRVARDSLKDFALESKRIKRQRKKEMQRHKFLREQMKRKKKRKGC